MEKTVAKLSKTDVVRVRHNVGSDSTGDLAIFFRVALTNSASKADALPDVADRVSEKVFQELRPLENWG